MQRIVEGTYASTEEAIKAVERLLNEGYLAEELLIITDEKHEDELEDLTLVDVESVEDDEDNDEDDEEESLWDKIKETFRMGDYTNDNESNTLVEHGVDVETAEHFSESLENHEIIILTNSTAPAHSKQLSSVNKDVLNDDEKNEASLSAKEQVEPSETETKEAMNPATGEGELFDPSKSQSAREDVPGTSTASSPDKEVNHDNSERDLLKQDRKDAPHLTGDEETVNTEEGNHVYPDNISTGVVGEGLTVETEPRKAEHPNPHNDIPESDAYYSNKYENAGGKTIKDDEEQ
ncbi:Heat induced stress protein YflT [Carnobacterium iners]|uniref:Heat induced stress protein YflT n=1 Tax=Carnobacterium iners TaxID=1073423 RepID=A0A1X7NBG1_9LACT|nr:general stress protein [Carnobacterium iners]SEL10902.1 Heat induced stress protein YflT [Carnobacterium iners]SMH34963.1 Heat induced stress protein YflT [Carnobacterium iners]